MSDYPFFSVVIPSYNRANKTCEAIDSVISQTYKSFEIIVVDDGSTDGTRDILKEKYRDHIRYEYINNSGGPATPRNIGIQLAVGKWICFLDADDVWYENKLDSIYSEILSNPNIGVITHNVDLYNQSGHIGIFKCGSSGANLLDQLVLEGNLLSTSATSVLRDVFYNNSVFFNTSRQYIGVEDYDLWLRLSMIKINFLFIDKELGKYMIFDDSLSSDTNRIEYNRLNVISNFLTEVDFKSSKARSIAIDYYLYRRELIEHFRNRSFINLLISFIESPFFAIRLIFSRKKNNSYIMFD